MTSNLTLAAMTAYLYLLAFKVGFEHGWDLAA